MLRIFRDHLKARLRWVWWVVGVALVAGGAWAWRELEKQFRIEEPRLLGADPDEETKVLPEIAGSDHPAFATARTETHKLDFIPPPQVGGFVPRSEEELRIHYGISVAVEGDLLAVGSPAIYSYGKDAGVVTFYQLRDGRWEQESHVVPEDIGPNLGFGRCLVLRKDRIAVTSGLGGDRRTFFGRVYVFGRDDSGVWRQEACFDGEGDGQETQFGIGLALAENVLAIGAHGEVVDGIACGAVHISERTEIAGWQALARVLPPRLPAGTTRRFGLRVAGGEGFVVATGAWRAVEDAPEIGVVHVIAPVAHDGAGRPTWEVVQTLTTERNGVRYDCDVAVDGDRFVLCGYEGTGGRGRCRLRIYRRTSGGERTFELEQSVLLRSPRISIRWAPRVAMAGDFIAIAMPARTDLGEGAGAVALVRRDADTGRWDPAGETLLPSDGHAGARFGYNGLAVKPDGGTVVSCAWWGVGDWKPGAVYWYGPPRRSP